jgi:demethylspheroidene O-methyltransferase
MELSWIDRMRGFRVRLIASKRFQRWASSSRLTRWLVQRRGRELFDLCAGFVYSQILLACVRLRLFDILFEKPLTLDELAERLALSKEATARLVAGATSLRLIERRGRDRYGLGEIGAALVANAAAAALIEHQPMLYLDLVDPVALLRGRVSNGEGRSAEGPGTGLSRYWAYATTASPAELTAEQVAPYSALMAVSQPLIAQEVLDSYPMEKNRCLLDVGGGEGVFLAAAAARVPGLRIMLFDLPAVAERAKARFAAAGLADRAVTFGGDFRSDPLPEGADVVSLIRIIHDHDDDAALDILRNIRRVLPEDGTLLIIEAMSGLPGAEPVGDAYYAFYTLAMGSGRPRTPEAIGRLLQAAGFARHRIIPTRMPVLTSIILARPGRS